MPVFSRFWTKLCASIANRCWKLKLVKKALNYVKARGGLSDETIKIWGGLGYAPGGGWDTLLKHFAKTEFQVSELEDAGLLTLRDDGSSYDASATA